jgi:hypothetical protein
LWERAGGGGGAGTGAGGEEILEKGSSVRGEDRFDDNMRRCEGTLTGEGGEGPTEETIVIAGGGMMGSVGRA